jgi:hypothetical protein
LAKSKAKKYREKRIREGKRNPENGRSPFVNADMHTRMTKTKKASLYRKKYKNHFSHEEKNGSFYIVMKPALLSILEICPNPLKSA